MARPSSKQRKGGGAKPRLGEKNLRVSASSRSLELFHDDVESGVADDYSPASVSSMAHDAEESSIFGKQLFKLVFGVLLLPVAFVLTGGFLGTIKQSAHLIQRDVLLAQSLQGSPNQWIHLYLQSIQSGGLLDQNPFLYLAVGMLLFAVFFFLAPRETLMLPYIFGHEVTHAFWVKLFGGNVANRFHVSMEGGHVLTDRVNTWIVLSPYFFPIYAVLVGTLYGALLFSGKLLDAISHSAAHRSNLCESIVHFHWLFLLLIGFALAFHLTFTFLLVTKSQPDLHYGGTFFSITVIYIINLLLVTALLLSTSSHWLWGDYGVYLLKSAELFVELCGQLWIWGADGVDAIRGTFGRATP